MSDFSTGPVLAVLNVHSGWDDGSDCREQLVSQFEKAGVALRIEQVSNGSDITGLVEGAPGRGFKGVIAAGGDGTLNAVAQGLRGTDVPMAVIPIGTLNHLARDLGVPLNVGLAIEALGHSREITMDLGEVNGRVFLNNSIIGLYPAYRSTRDRLERRGWAKWRAIASAIFGVFRREPSLNVHLRADGREFERKTPYILVANNEHRLEGYRLGERGRLDEGRLWVHVMRPHSRWGMIRMAFSLLFGTFRKKNEFEIFSAESLRVASRRTRIGVAIDGDVVNMKMPLEYRSLPAALHVLTPRALTPID